MADLYILTAVKTVISVQSKVRGPDIFAIHPEIVPVYGDVVKLDIPTVPKGFLGIRKGHVFKANAFTATEIFRRGNNGVADRNVVRVPYPRPRVFKKGGIIDLYIFSVPERIFVPEKTGVRRNIAALLQGGLAVFKDTVVKVEIFRMKERPFLGVFFSSYFHFFFSLQF